MYVIMKNDVKRLKNLFKKLRSDFVFNTLTGSALSSLSTLAFALYNVYLGIRYGALWNYCTAIYCAILALTKACTVYTERRLSLSVKDEAALLPIRVKACLSESVVLLIIDLTLIVPVSLMVTQQRALDYSAIPAIATAAYTV